jgi:dihydrofolate reductase
MPLVRYQVAVSLDGFIAPKDGSIDWLEDSAGSSEFAAFIETIGGIVMGRASFELNLSFGQWNWTQPTVVMSSRPFEKPLPEGVTACSGTPADALALLEPRMKGGDIWLFGGGRTAAQFLDAGLIDRIELAVVPTALGSGLPLFEGGASHARDFKILRAEPKDGLVMLDYERR